MEAEKVSVIIPVYNAEKTVYRSLESLRKQTYKNIEVIVLDDGSTDGSLDICRHFASEDDRFKIISLVHTGNVAAVRNRGLEMYTGEYLMFADADDLVSTNYIERLYEVLNYTDCNIAVCVAHDSTDYSIDEYEWIVKSSPELIPIEKYDFTKGWSHRVVWGAIFKRSAVYGLIFDEKYHSSTDTLFMAEMLKREKAVAHINEPLYMYMFYPDSISHRPYDWKRFSDICIWDEIASRIFADGPYIPQKSAEVCVVMKSITALKEMKDAGIKNDELKKELLKKARQYFSSAMSFKEISLRTKISLVLYSAAPEFFLQLRKLKKIFRQIVVNNYRPWP